MLQLVPTIMMHTSTLDIASKWSPPYYNGSQDDTKLVLVYTKVDPNSQRRTTPWILRTYLERFNDRRNHVPIHHILSIVLFVH